MFSSDENNASLALVKSTSWGGRIVPKQCQIWIRPSLQSRRVLDDCQGACYARYTAVFTHAQSHDKRSPVSLGSRAPRLPAHCRSLWHRIVHPRPTPRILLGEKPCATRLPCTQPLLDVVHMASLMPEREFYHITPVL